MMFTPEESSMIRHVLMFESGGQKTDTNPGGWMTRQIPLDKQEIALACYKKVSEAIVKDGNTMSFKPLETEFLTEEKSYLLSLLNMPFDVMSVEWRLSLKEKLS